MRDIGYEIFAHVFQTLQIRDVVQDGDRTGFVAGFVAGDHGRSLQLEGASVGRGNLQMPRSRQAGAHHLAEGFLESGIADQLDQRHPAGGRASSRQPRQRLVAEGDSQTPSSTARTPSAMDARNGLAAGRFHETWRAPPARARLPGHALQRTFQRLHFVDTKAAELACTHRFFAGFEQALGKRAHPRDPPVHGPRQEEGKREGNRLTATHRGQPATVPQPGGAMSSASCKTMTAAVDYQSRGQEGAPRTSAGRSTRSRRLGCTDVCTGKP